MIWIVVGVIIFCLVGSFAYAISGFCICDAPITPDPENFFIAGGAAFGVWSICCGIAYLLRRSVFSIWITVLSAFAAVGSGGYIGLMF